MEHFSFRTLFYDLEVAPRLRTFAPEIWANDAYRDVLMPYLDDTLRAMEPLRVYGNIEARHWRKRKTGLAYDDPHHVNLWRLYALSRVSDILLAPLTPVGDTAHFSPFNETWETLPLRLDERTAWFRALGMRPIEATSFHPFYHEIVSVDQSSDPAEPITLVETLWPGFMLGEMLFCRAGVRVRGGSQHINKPIAETSTLHWTYRRNNRSTDDLSHGWGSNSQWGTDFRRDYDSATTFYYNVDGEVPVDEPHPYNTRRPPEVRLTTDERLELLTHRCFIVTDKPHTDLWHFDDTYEEVKPDQGWLRE